MSSISSLEGYESQVGVDTVDNDLQEPIRLAIEGAFERIGVSCSPTDLISFGSLFSVTQVQARPMKIAGMLTKSDDGYSVVLNAADNRTRQRFSFAHEIGHVIRNQIIGVDLLQCYRQGSQVKQREEAACDAIAAAILMPEQPFFERAASLHWSLGSVEILAQQFDTSITATAIRLTKLHPDPCALSLWPLRSTNMHKLRPKWKIRNAHCQGTRFDLIPRPGIDPFPILRTAAKTRELACGFEQTSVGRHQPGTVQEHYTEAKRFGAGENAFVLSLTYLDKAP